MFYPVHDLDESEIDQNVVVRGPCSIGLSPSRSPSLARPGLATRRIRIGAWTEIMPFVVIYEGAHIGENCLIGNHASIRENATIGNRCVIGRNVTINYDSVLEDEVRIQDGTHITGGCRIGRGTFIGVNVTTSNDKRREIVDYEFIGATPPVIGRGCLIGSGANIIPGIMIGDGAVIGAGALVTKDVPAGATVLGQGSRIVRQPSQHQAADAWKFYQEQQESRSNHVTGTAYGREPRA